MALARRAVKAQRSPTTAINPVSQFDLISLLHKKSVHELMLVEIAPAVYQLDATIAWRAGRWTLAGINGPRRFRSLDTAARFLKTIGAERIVTRLELLH